MTDIGESGASASGADRSGPDLAPRSGRAIRRRWGGRLLPGLVTAGVVIAVVLLIANLLGDAALFFYNADEAVERRAELGDDRFRVQGTPVDNSVVEGFRGDEPVVAFSIVFEGVTIDVIHVGDPPDLFQPGVPVVLEGAWTAGPPPVESFNTQAGEPWHFASDRMLVKHDNDYRNRGDFQDRIDEAEQGGLVGVDG